WVLEPRDPLVLRDGRPNVGRSAPRLRPFPLPSTIAGACRTRVGSDESGSFSVPESRLDELLRVPVRGPLLVDRERGTLYVPPPADATLFRDEAGGYLLRGVRPADVPSSARVDHDLGDLQLLLMDDPPSAKPDRSLRFWALDSALAWLLGALEPNAEPRPRHQLVDGLEALPTESRTHVALGPGGTAREGFLFESEGLRFEILEQREGARRSIPLGLHVEVGAFDGRDAPPGIAPLGGERRLVRWRPSEPLWPAPPDALLEAAAAGDEATLRVHLLTPGLFEGGWRPGSGSPLLAGDDGLQAELIAASVGAPLSISGWSLRERRPKPSRRAAPAGSVLWVRLRGPAEARRRWVQRHWLQNVSCDEQDRLDGWGLALIGVQR
ncbi:MAG TPA: type III-B CRISPR module-associated Cmr3 family protein, partial [Polyangiaceae bacterium LLY-WYZ-15_(1-7)]|nr:type III-B CRISPR module-associated Cmr3 family protein [Polyangiaceae bacterium LLY-WYZ-15_(1-7)]